MVWNTESVAIIFCDYEYYESDSFNNESIPRVPSTVQRSVGFELETTLWMLVCFTLYAACFMASSAFQAAEWQHNR
jgi:hypothetical protein